MKSAAWGVVLLLASAMAVAAQDQQLGARTKAMGGSYTAFEDDPVSVCLNPAGIATQPDQLSIAYQTYTAYPKGRERGPGDTVDFTVKPVTIMGDPALLPSYIGFVFQVGDAASPLAIGFCYAQPYLIDYAMDQVKDPNQPTFVPEAEVQQVFGRFRVSVAKDFRIQDVGTPGFFTHVSGGVALDLGYERWEFKSTTRSASDNATGLGGGVGLLLGVYDNIEDLRVNFGVAWQSGVRFGFSIDPDILPAFDMPQQLNTGATFSLLKGFPLRATIDLQWIDWSETADVPLFPGKKKFRDAFNYSAGFEYRIAAGAGINLYPRVGYRRVNAAWSDKNNLPMTSDFQLVLDTKGSAFNIFTLGGGISWSSDDGRVRAVDLGADVGGDSYTIAFGVTYEF